MSPITMAILGLLAYKAVKSMSHREEQQPAAPRPAGDNIAADDTERGGMGGMSGTLPAGGAGDVLRGTLGGLLAGGAAGGALSGGLNDFLKELQTIRSRQ